MASGESLPRQEAENNDVFLHLSSLLQAGTS
jgi:hypothetical protein